MPYGLKKRVELARALAAEPDLLLLDEPMAGMNVEEKEDMSRFILDVNDEFGTTIALIEHDMGVVMDISDHVVVIDFERHVRSTLDRTFDVGLAASAIGTSRRTLERRISAVLGLTPLGLVQRLRLERARHLKATTDLTTDDIALRVGYANAESLRALMRRGK